MAIKNPYFLRNFRPKSAAVADNGFSATLVRGTRSVATVDCGQGPDDDSLRLTFVDQAELDFFSEAVELLAAHGAFPLPEENGAPIAADALEDAFIRELAERTYHALRLQDLCKHNTLFRLPTDPPASWRVVRAPFRPALVSAISARHRGAAVQFANMAG